MHGALPLFLSEINKFVKELKEPEKRGSLEKAGIVENEPEDQLDWGEL